ncbi:conserved hypothetical protein [Methanococcus vannielii SB]|uniref:Uncharacterized protein n=1 Tax=Methanococcus vannielii (strain ATCC 35089 / DSM 1224 / JCM 13029 / OCM 148 / SB) TaxID=406327 RepID=A6US94_METVS|nr:class III signal peptide-containing protein [Methanococcus vannielii]ABR55366.1 conserved hypothetical protein [Methanococcus vannielii SB]
MAKLLRGQISIEFIILLMAVLLVGTLVSVQMTKSTFESSPINEVRKNVFGAITIGGVTTEDEKFGFSLNISGLSITPTGSIQNFELHINDTRKDIEYRYNIEKGDKGLILINGTKSTHVSVYPDPVTGYASEVTFRTSNLNSLLLNTGTEVPIPQYINKFIISANNPEKNPIKYSVSKDSKNPSSSQLLVDFKGNDVNITLIKAGGGGSVYYTLINNADGSISIVEI